MQAIANQDDRTDEATAVIAGKIIHALEELRAFTPDTSIPMGDLCRRAGVSSCEFAHVGHRIASDEYVVMPLGHGCFAGVYLCLDPSVIEKAAYDLKRRAVRAESQAYFLSGAAERMCRHTATCAERDDGVETAQGT